MKVQELQMIDITNYDQSASIKTVSLFQILNQEPKDDSQQKIVIEKIQGELDNARQEIKKLECDLKLSEEDRMQHRLMKGKLDNYNRMEKTIESLRIENKLLNDTADNSQLLKEQVPMCISICNWVETFLEDSLKGYIHPCLISQF